MAEGRRGAGLPGGGRRKVRASSPAGGGRLQLPAGIAAVAQGPGEGDVKNYNSHGAFRPASRSRSGKGGGRTTSPSVPRRGGEGRGAALAPGAAGRKRRGGAGQGVRGGAVVAVEGAVAAVEGAVAEGGGRFEAFSSGLLPANGPRRAVAPPQQGFRLRGRGGRAGPCLVLTEEWGGGGRRVGAVWAAAAGAGGRPGWPVGCEASRWRGARAVLGVAYRGGCRPGRVLA